VKKNVKDQVAEGPQRLRAPKQNENIVLGNSKKMPPRNYRWTSLEDQFVERANKFTKEIDQTRAERGDYDPLYSSFNPNGTFNPPPASIDVRNKQREYQKTSISGTMTNKSMGLRANTALNAEESLMGTGQNSINLFARATTVENQPAMSAANRSFKNSTHKGIRSGAFRQL